MSKKSFFRCWKMLLCKKKLFSWFTKSLIKLPNKSNDLKHINYASKKNVKFCFKMLQKFDSLTLLTIWKSLITLFTKFSSICSCLIIRVCRMTLEAFCFDLKIFVALKKISLNLLLQAALAIHGFVIQVIGYLWTMNYVLNLLSAYFFSVIRG